MAGAGRRKRAGRITYLVVGLLALSSGGCLLAVAGTAAGTAAVGYVYFKGRMTQDFPANLPDVVLAMRSGLADLHLPILKDEPKPDKAYFLTQTTDGCKIRIHLEPLDNRLPVGGPVTRVTVRVLPLGDDAVSARILDQAQFYLTRPLPVPPQPAPPSQPPVTVSPPVPVPPPPIRPVSAPPQETTQPPLAPAKAGARN